MRLPSRGSCASRSQVTRSFRTNLVNQPSTGEAETRPRRAFLRPALQAFRTPEATLQTFRTPESGNIGYIVYVYSPVRLKGRGMLPMAGPNPLVDRSVNALVEVLPRCATEQHEYPGVHPCPPGYSVCMHVAPGEVYSLPDPTARARPGRITLGVRDPVADPDYPGQVVRVGDARIGAEPRAVVRGARRLDRDRVGGDGLSSAVGAKGPASRAVSPHGGPLARRPG